MSTTTPTDLEVFGVVTGLFQVNTFFLRRADSAEAVIIDPGDEPEKISGVVLSHGWRPVAVINTHGHLDHIGAVQYLRERFEIPFYLHPADEAILRAAPEHAEAYGVPIPTVPAVDRHLEDRQTLDIAGLAIQVIHTPGHTPGGVCFVVPGRVFAGDTLFHGSIGRTDLPGGDHGTLLQSIHERLLALSDETIVHAGHGPDTTIGRERRRNPFLRTPASPPRSDARRIARGG